MHLYKILSQGGTACKLRVNQIGKVSSLFGKTSWPLAHLSTVWSR